MGKALRILFIEDDENDLRLSLETLRNGGYTVTYERVQTPEGMEDALSRKEWDIIISDYHMPNFSALTAFQLLQVRNLDIPFVLVSGTLGPQLAAAAMRSGISDYLEKIDIGKRLIPAVERAISECNYRRRKTSS